MKHGDGAQGRRGVREEEAGGDPDARELQAHIRSLASTRAELDKLKRKNPSLFGTDSEVNID